jgi:uncharacterized membrane protein YbaN (DUF454 family)
MKAELLRFTFLSLGVICVVIGILGLVLPLIPGILTIFLGVYLITLTSSPFKEWFEKHITRYPKVHHHYKKNHEHMKGFFSLFKK